MKTVAADRKILFAVAVSVLLVLLPLLALPFGLTRPISALVLAAAAIIAVSTVKKRSSFSINKRKVLVLSALCAVVYLALYYALGGVFGFVTARAGLSLTIAMTHLLPSAVMIIATEIIRTLLLIRKDKTVRGLSFVIGIVSELLVGGGLSGITTMHRFMDVAAITLIPAVTANILYHYSAKRYGCLPNIVYRSILTLYVYFINVDPNLSGAMESLALMLFPFAVYFLLYTLYERKEKIAGKRIGWKTFTAYGVLMALIISVVMLISCQFTYGILVIATPSMTGALNVGDAVVFESYDDQIIAKGDVIIYVKDRGERIVHRVVDIQRINGENRYYTKGDANEKTDSGYVTSSQIEGVVSFRIAGIGHPSLWLRNIFKS